MKFVVDANILFALAKSSSTASLLTAKHNIKLFAPDFALVELYKYKNELEKKSDIGKFKDIIESLKKRVVFIDNSEYKAFLKKALSLISDPKDAAYISIALKFSLPIWSNDEHFKDSKTETYTTEELIRLLS